MFKKRKNALLTYFGCVSQQHMDPLNISYDELIFFLHLPPLFPQEWYPHFFVLTSTKIYYSEETSNNQGNDDEEEHREVSMSTALALL